MDIQEHTVIDLTYKCQSLFLSASGFPFFRSKDVSQSSLYLSLPSDIFCAPTKCRVQHGALGTIPGLEEYGHMGETGNNQVTS